MNKINIFKEGIALPYKKISGIKIKELALKIFETLDIDNIAAAIIITDNDTIQNINKKYRNKNKPTDVISFANRDMPFPDIEGINEELGDIYISIEKADAQANDFNVPIIIEIKRLLIHGILHLLGYDHEKSKKHEKIMNEKEEELLKIIQ